MKLFNLPQIDANLTAWFILDGKEYEMDQFNISFGQSVDHKGQPQRTTTKRNKRWTYAGWFDTDIAG